jgi:hypothetical protein
MAARCEHARDQRPERRKPCAASMLNRALSWVIAWACIRSTPQPSKMVCWRTRAF